MPRAGVGRDPVTMKPKDGRGQVVGLGDSREVRQVPGHGAVPEYVDGPGPGFVQERHAGAVKGDGLEHGRCHAGERAVIMSG